MTEDTDLDNLIQTGAFEIEATEFPTGLRRVRITCDNPEDALKIIEEIMPSPKVQQKYKHTYQILAFVSGAGLLVSLLALAVFIPSPTPFQSRIFLSVLALAAGAFGVVITGLLDVKATLGKQITIGATGALALVVLMLFVDPTN